MVDVTKENHIGGGNPVPCASPPTVSIGPVYDLKMPPFVSPADHQSIRQAALLEGVRIERAAVVAWLRGEQGKGSDAGIDYADAFSDAIERGEHITDPAVVIARHGG